MNKVTKVTTSPLLFNKGLRSKTVANAVLSKPVPIAVEQTTSSVSETLPTQLQPAKQVKLEKRNLAPGWNSHTPFLNAWVKVFPPENRPLWMLVWIKDDAVHYYDAPVSKNSLIYKHITSQNEDKHKVLDKCERLLVKAFLEAKDFIAGDKEVQEGFEIVRRNGYLMTAQGFLGIEMDHRKLDFFIKLISDDNLNGISIMWNYFKGSFAHEMTHFLRDEIEVDENIGQEIAAQAVEMLICGGENPIKDTVFEEAIKDPDTKYKQDMITALKVVYRKLFLSENCTYKPLSFEPDELNKAMQSISKEKRYEVLKAVAEEIVETSPVELFRLASLGNLVSVEDKADKDIPA